MDLELVLKRAVELGASDIHLKVGQPPILRRDGELSALDGEPALTERDLELALDEVCAQTRQAAADLPRDRRARHRLPADRPAALPRQRLPPARRDLVRLPRDPERGARTSTSLGLPPGVARLAEEHRGLVLVTGATGSGKTTTLAAMIGHINRTRRQHIVTIEDPIEILHADHSCIVNQREVGLDTESFGAGAPPRAPPGPGRDPDRRAARRRDRRDRARRPPSPATSSSRRCTRSTRPRRSAAWSSSSRPAKQQQIRSILAGVLRGVDQPAAAAARSTAAASPRSR